MNTLDKFFIDNLGPSKIDYTLLFPRDRKILVSFRTQLLRNIFFTERQANLLVKILKDNKKIIESQTSSIDEVIDEVKWSKDFRTIEKIRKISLEESEKSSILVKFNFDKTIKDKLYLNSGKFIGNFVAVSSTEFKVSFNENNLMLLKNELKEFKFEFDEKLTLIIEKIEEILKNKEEHFNILTTSNQKLINAVKKDIGEISEENILLLQDRKIRYQYKIFKEIEKNTLASKIAHRTSTKIFINSEQYTLTDVIVALNELKRFPILTIFEGHSSFPNKESLDTLAVALENINLKDNVGIYFRFDTDQDHAGFNKLINHLNFNQQLSDKTQVAGIANNKLPKFMLKTSWRSSTVISFSNNFKSNKASVYACDADLIIFYSKTKPLGGNINDIL